ncbi:unnamed protein product [Hymenolepis diminuta]|uniref:Aminotran_5 domain-containing protein n=1 Tax=Hymenolepis diminuta TaxID=6216 RepID=A0A0R3S7J9_HYMDI|nr:unnamed protein product [Hymenolepis diminuta]
MAVVRGPFGDRRVVYCDFTASGLSLKFFEEFISNEVLPEYANVHSFLAGMSCQTTTYRNDAKNIIKEAVNASDDDALIFCGSGTTGAIHKLIHNINLNEAPIVLVGPFEHHSNLLPWRHLAQKVIRLKTNSDGGVSMSYLEDALRAESKTAKKLGCQILVCLSAASNVTGILVDTNAASSLVHRYGGIIFWDYATAAPYVEMNMNPPSKGGDSYKDALFFSVHKFVGGPQTPGILVAKKRLFEAGETFPHQSGGGTVNFVRREHTSYFKEVEVREEGGTPAIIESIRAGMVIQLKEAIGTRLIQKREEDLVHIAWSRFAECPNLVILGGSKAKRIAIFSFLVRHTRGSYVKDSKYREDNCLFIHHDFICALLNDLFGIQSRSGCACAGPYALDLLGINEEMAISYEDTLISKDNEEIFDHKILRPGFTRVNLPFFYPDEEIDFIIDAIIFIAKYAWTFLPFYELDQNTGQWRYCKDKRTDMSKHLSYISYDQGVMRWRKPTSKSAGPVPSSHAECLSLAKSLQQSLESVLRKSNFGVTNERVDRYWLHSKYNNLRWFLLSSEAAADARGLPRPASQYPNTGSPWHPGCIERCFCPDLAKTDNESLLRLCKYTNARGMNPMGDGKYAHYKKVSRNDNYYNNLGRSSSEGSTESNSGGDVVCFPRGSNYSRVSPTRVISRSPRIGRLGTCERNPNNYQIPRNMMSSYRNSSSSPKRYSSSGEAGWYSPPPPLMRPTVQVSFKRFLFA